MKSTVWKPSPPPGLSYKRENLLQIRSAARFIHQVGEIPELRTPSREIPVTEISSETTQAKIRYARHCLRRYTRLTHGKGKGLAAIQVGIHERFFVAYLDEVNKIIGVFINPVITGASDKRYRYKEACMSANSLVAPVVRPAWIEFSYYDEKGKQQLWDTKEATPHDRMLNRVFQHEIDHLAGIINIDKVDSRSLEYESAPGPKKPEFIEVTPEKLSL